MIRWALFGLALLAGVAAAGLVTLGAAGPSRAITIPRIDGDGNNEDTPFLPAGVPVLHVHVNPHWFAWVRSTTPLNYLIDCPTACRRPVGAGTSVTLQAHPDPGYRVVWGILDAPSTLVCQGQSANICSFTMPGPTTGLPATGELQVIANIVPSFGSAEETAPVAGRTRTRPPRPR
jgi:hypothetical protein